MVDFPTRNNKFLDILLTNNASLVLKVADIPGISDHTSIAITDIQCHPLRNRPIKRTVYMWNRANIPELKVELKNKITEYCSNQNSNTTALNVLWDEFKTIVNSIMDKVPSWITQECKRLSRRKKRWYNRAKRTKMQPDWDKFKRISSECKKACKNAHSKYINEKIIGTDNRKNLFRYIKSKRKDNVSVAPLQKEDKFVIDDLQKSNILNEQYCSVFSQPNQETQPINSPRTENAMSDIKINELGILALLNRLQTKKATGPDTISARFLNEFAAEIAPAVTMICTISFEQGELPNDWLHAFIVPVYKGGNKDRSNAENYRPISLTSICCKIMEHIIYSNVMSHLNKNDIISNTQHGFRGNHSCESQLLFTVNDLATGLNDSKQIDTI